MVSSLLLRPVKVPDDRLFSIGSISLSASRCNALIVLLFGNKVQITLRMRHFLVAKLQSVDAV